MFHVISFVHSNGPNNPLNGKCTASSLSWQTLHVCESGLISIYTGQCKWQIDSYVDIIVYEDLCSCTKSLVQPFALQLWYIARIYSWIVMKVSLIPNYPLACCQLHYSLFSQCLPLEYHSQAVPCFLPDLRLTSYAFTELLAFSLASIWHVMYFFCSCLQGSFESWYFGVWRQWLLQTGHRVINGLV